ncbi:dynein regulatory complex protein 9 isoform X6 [Peromyscus californicus insignis]|uniref:dynein regulatory complex protein 9 isoform X6 n=1 Tax=Peromyscus californicus insignis TaxID=564181 RepID=UPI0022A7DF20|nr:dynein regulatory complex protein 9 isoform X6 [Peromyscus californicus insignis]
MEGLRDQLEALDFSSEALHPEVTVVVTGEPPGAIEEESENEEEEETPAEVIDSLSLLDVLRVSAVMEDIIDQLSILSYIIPVQYERRQSVSQKSSHEGTSVVSSTRKTSLTKERSTVPETKQRGLDSILKKPTRQTMMTLETLKKIENDRQYLSDVIANTMREMQDSGSFKSLLEALDTERDKKMHFHEAITREEKGRREIKSLQKQLIDVKKECQMQVQKLEEKLEFWMEKFDKDTEAKQNELNALKAAKATNLSHLQDLAKTIREYEQVIIEDRMEKEKTRKKMEQDDLELKSIVKLQAWWRGTVVRKEIGGFKMPKKGKDDGKDSKGKEKDKRRGKK